MEQQLLQLERDIKEDPLADCFLVSRLDAKLFVEISEERRVLEYDGDRIVACVFAWNTKREDTLEVGTMWVHADYRGGGRMKKLWHKMMEQLQELKHINQVVTVTKIERIIRFVEGEGWEIAAHADWDQLLLGRDPDLGERSVFVKSL